jgi:hypothetical protein
VVCSEFELHGYVMRLPQRHAQGHITDALPTGARTAGLKLYGGDGHEVRPIDKLKISTAAGGFAGMVAGALRK